MYFAFDLGAPSETKWSDISMLPKHLFGDLVKHIDL